MLALRLSEMVSKSPAAREMLRLAARVAPSDSTLLLLGETGVGKDWLAQAIHGESPRAKGPFVAVNCGAVPENLLESELFGHERGAFTGASQSRRGYFELAHRGTLYLDEIGEMPAALQVKLLRAIQERTIQRLGSERTLEVDVRIIAATHRDLATAMKEGTFRRDLYYRLAVVTIVVPALRDRREDIPDLARGYLAKFARKLGRGEALEFTPEALAALETYPWPGNVRELTNVIERAVLLSESERIGPADLPEELTDWNSQPRSAAAAEGPATAAPLDVHLDLPLEEARAVVIDTFERRYLERLLERNRGNVGLTARQAGIDPRTLYNKMRQLGLSKEQFKARS